MLERPSYRSCHYFNTWSLTCYITGKFAIFSSIHENIFFLMLNQVGGTRKHWYGCHKAKGVNIKLAIWDTAGNEGFNCITPVSVKYTYLLS